MKKFAAGILSLLPLLCTAFPSGAAVPQVRASLTPDTILIGDRFSIEVLIDKDMMQVVSLPAFDGARMAKGIEIVSETPLDTLNQDGRRQTLRKTYELTAFEAGAYDLGRYPVLYADKNITDTLYSAEPLLLVVNTLPVDTETETIYDIKPPRHAPLLVSEVAGYAAAGAVGATAIAALALLLARAMSKRRLRSGKRGRGKPSVPPHVRAIQELETLHNQKLWQSGKIKAYYTRLTDIIREYLSGRYGINAMEMTSDEILRACAPLELLPKNAAELRDILLTSDLVKFAKHIPDAEANDSLYYAAYYFVEETKEIPAEQIPEEEQGANNEK